MAQWLNTVFASFDYSILNAFSKLAENCGAFFTPFFKTITFLGEKGVIFIIAAVILMLFRKTRKVGICTFGAVACGALITNIILKDLVARLRPFQSSSIYYEWWIAVGCPTEDGYSFPSGHVTAIFAAMTAVFLTCNKKYAFIGFFAAIIMAASRCYLMAHYPSDVLFASIIGVLSAVAAYYVTKLIYYVANKYSSKKFFNFILYFNLLDLFVKPLNKKD